MIKDYQDEVWEKNPEFIRRFYDLLPMHERLCHEVEFILNTEMKKSNIEFAHITRRAKSVKSFCEKIYRKSYRSPFSEIIDLAGARVVYLYPSDIVSIETIIENEFDIIEKVNKVNSNEIEKFGYGALHYVVKMRKNHCGARYDDLKQLVCEIQVRTILQDAWAVVAHHLSYKQESDIPKELRRKLNALSGLFETADDQFERLRTARAEYQEKIKNEISKHKFISLEKEINLDNLAAYLEWKFPDRRHGDVEAISYLFSELKELEFSRLIEIDKVYEKSKIAVLAYEENEPPSDSDVPGKNTKYNTVGLIRMSLLFLNEKYAYDKYSDAEEVRGKYLHLIEENA